MRGRNFDLTLLRIRKRNLESLSMVQTASRRALTEEARVLSPASPCGIGGGQSDSGTCLYSTIGFLPLLRSTNDSYSSTSTRRSDLKHK